MTTKQIVELIENIVDRQYITPEKRKMLTTLVDLLISFQPTQINNSPRGTVTYQTSEPNEVKSDSGETVLDESTPFTMPSEINIKVEGQEEVRKVTLVPTPTVQ